ncbi:hypothetical protein pdam_00014463, partial [Pocillopora damicornis]
CQLQQEKRALRGQKRKLKASLADEQAKRLKRVKLQNCREMEREGRTKPHQSRLRQQKKENCQATPSFLGLCDFIATKVEVFNGETQQYETFSLIDQNELPLKGQ